MLVVVDTSVILAVVLNEPSKPTLIQLTAGAELIAPASLPWEIGNALSAMLKRRRLTLDEARHALVEYRKIPIRLLDVSLDDTITVAAQLTIYAYDAYMIACARTHSAPLVTIDNGLKVAAQAAGLTTLEITP
jgi:predicted nucleic acid-binding protein